MKNWKRFSIAAFGTLSIVGTSVFAATGIVNAPSGLVLRGEANKSGKPLATVPDKTEVNIVEEIEEWYKVTYNSQEGYLFKEYVNVEEKIDVQEEISTEETSTGTKVVNKIKVYNIPLITSTVIKEIEPNVEITIHKQITNWSYVSAGNIQGWVRTYGIENHNQKPELPNETPQEKPDENPVQQPEEPNITVEEPADNTNSQESPITETKGFVNVDYANVRKQASTDSEIVTTLTKDTSFTITAETEEWYKIKYTSPENDVYEGYMFKDLTTLANN